MMDMEICVSKYVFFVEVRRKSLFIAVNSTALLWILRPTLKAQREYSVKGMLFIFKRLASAAGEGLLWVEIVKEVHQL